MHVSKYPGGFLVNRLSGSRSVCSASDLRLTLADDMEMRHPLLATARRQLTAA
jgi:hypothetical protein